MAGITHTKVSIIADDPNYDIQPGDWNAEHTIAATIPNVATTAAGDLIVGNGTVWQKKSKAEWSTKKWEGTISNPQALYAQRAQLGIGYTNGAITISSIIVRLNTASAGAELAADLKFADDIFAASLANATLVNALDTTAGVLTKTSSFTDATIPTGKFVYIQFDSSPHADILDIFIQILYTVD